MEDPSALSAYDALQLIAESLAALTGAEVATVAVVRGDRLEVVAVAGAGPAIPPAPLELPLRDEDGTQRGVLAAYLADGSWRPDERQRRALETYATQATRAVLTILRRERLAEQLRLAGVARHVVRQASEHRSLQHLLEAVRRPLLDALQARGTWIQTFDEDGLGRGSVYSADGRDVEITEGVYTIAYATARTLWDHQRTVVLSSRRPSGLLSAEQSREVIDFLARLEVDSILFVPLGAGHRCLGNLVLTRGPGAPEWTEEEAETAFEIGRDLGVAIGSVRAYERERRLVREVHVLESRLSGVVVDDTERDDLADAEDLAGSEPDLTRTRADLRAASDALEQMARRRDAQARILADALAAGESPGRGALEVYRDLRTEYRDAHLYWQVAFDSWQEVSARRARDRD